jgi:hypothetical protein
VGKQQWGGEKGEGCNSYDLTLDLMSGFWRYVSKVTSMLIAKGTKHCDNTHKEQAGEKRGSKISCTLLAKVDLMGLCDIQRQVSTDK